MSTPCPVAPPVVLPAPRDRSSTPVRAAIYCRISRDKVGAGLGIRRQESDCRVLADRLGWSVVDVYPDNDLSAYSGKHRPQYERLLSDIRAGKVTGVIAWHGDRLHRRPTELESYIDACEARGVETQTVKAGALDLSTPSGRMIARQLGTIARYEVEHAVERIKGAKAQARDAGQWLGGRAPFGYVKNGKYNLAVVEDEAALIRRGADDLLAGASLLSVGQAWNATGVTTRGGRRWDAELVGKVLRSPTTAGRVAHDGHDVGEATWPAILDADVWEGVRAVLDGQTVRKMRPRSPRRLLSGVAVCGRCGASMKAGMKASGVAIYRCSATEHVKRVAEPVDDYVAAKVIERLKRPDAVALLTPDRTAEVTELHSRIAALRARKADLGEAFAAGDCDRDGLKAGTARLRTGIAEAEERLAALSAGSVLDGLAGNPDVAGLWVELPIERRRAVVAATARVTILPGRRGGDARTRDLAAAAAATVRIDWTGAQV